MVTDDLQMSPHQHHLLEEKPVFGKADVHTDDPLNERINELESTLRYMAKTVSKLMNEKAIYQRQNRQLQSSNNLLALVSLETYSYSASQAHCESSLSTAEITIRATVFERRTGRL